jgi:hypothetical protein
MAQLKKGDIIQILRKGYYICDVPYDAATQQPCYLLNIPDGSTTKEKPTALQNSNTAAEAAAGAASNASTTTVASGPAVEQLIEQIVQQAEKVRESKAKKLAKVNEI